MKARLPYVQQMTDRHGRRRYYFRRGKARAPLPDPANGWPEFLAAYEKAQRAGAPRVTPSGTMASLINSYLESEDFRALKPNSKATYRHAIEWLRGRDSVNEPIEAFTRQSIRKMRDRLAAETPGKANLILKVLKRLLSFAVEEGDLGFNPATRLRMVKGGEHRSWTDAELLAFEARWPRGTLERLIYELALGTGQRRGDIAKMTWKDIDGGVVAVTQQKTGAKVWVPLHPSLAHELERMERRNLVVVATPSGRAFTPSYLGITFGRAAEAAGLPDDCVLHGLRKAASRRLAEAGCTDAEIMSITGHQTRSEVSRYTRDADAKKLAKRAVRKVVKLTRSREKGA